MPINHPIQDASQTGLNEAGSGETSSSTETNEGLVNQTQQLIDQVNQLLGKSPTPTGPVAPAAAPSPLRSSEEVADVASQVDLLKSYLANLEKTVDEPSAESEVEVVAEARASISEENLVSPVQEQAVAADEQLEVKQAEYEMASPAAEAPIAEAPVAEVQDASQTEASFEVEVSGAAHQGSAEQAAEEATSTVSADHSGDASAEKVSAMEKYLEELKQSFEDDSQVSETVSANFAEPTVEEPVVETPTVEVVGVEEQQGEEAVASDSTAVEVFIQEPVSVEAVAVEVVAEEPIAEEEPVSEELVAAEQAVEAFVNEAPAAEETINESPAAEETIVEAPAAEETIVEEPAAEETFVGDPVPLEPAVEADSAQETPESSDLSETVSSSDGDEDAEISVESWLAKNVSDYSASAKDESNEADSNETETETEAETEVETNELTHETEAETEEPAGEVVGASPLLDGIQAAFSVPESSVDEGSGLAASSDVSQPTSSETLVFEEGDIPTPSTGSIEERVAGLEMSVASTLRNVEKRMCGMFESISAQIEGLASGSYAAPSLVSSDVRIAGEDEEASSGVTETTAEPTTVESLKEQLTAKLREAEIELSINRAKLSQQRASIEQMQADLERREAGLEAKLAKAGKTKAALNADKKRGMMDRWKRHLGENEG